MSGKTQITLNDLARIAETMGVPVGNLLPKSEREVTLPFPAVAFPAQRSPLTGPIDPTGRTARTMPRQSIDKTAQRASARSSRNLEPCGSR